MKVMAAPTSGSATASAGSDFVVGTVRTIRSASNAPIKPADTGTRNR